MSGHFARRGMSLLILLVLGCNDAVTDPSRAGFEADPRLIEGDWAALITTGTQTRRFDAELVAAGGVFIGRFDFLHSGQLVQLFFSEAEWDGVTLEFTAETPVGSSAIDLRWTARYVPAEGEEPDRLLLLSDLFLAPIEYVRPGDLPEGAP